MTDDQVEQAYVAAIGGDDTDAAPSMFVISSIHVWHRGSHDLVGVWNRGGLAGSLTVAAGDGRLLAELLGLVPRP